MPILALAGEVRTPLAAGFPPPAYRPVSFSPVPSLRQLLSRHPTLLVIDACSPCVEASAWRAGPEPRPVAVASAEGEASGALPSVVARALAEVGLRIGELDAVAFCDGPGSVLGIRLSAATLRAWRAVRPALSLYSFHSLPLLAVAEPGLTIIADARRDSWHAVRARSPHELLRLPSAELAAAGPLGTPANFRRWSSLPVGVEPRALPYSAARLLAAVPEAAFFQEAPEPEAFMHELPSYVAWKPQVHQAPTAK